MAKAMLTGSFDPVTLGHVDVVKKALERFDEVCVAMLINPDKVYTFSWEKRLRMLKATFEPMGVAVYAGTGLAVDLAKEVGADVMVRGIRRGDEQYEQELAALNMKIGGVPTEFVYADGRFAGVSSTVVKNRLKAGEDVTDLVPASIIKEILEV